MKSLEKPKIFSFFSFFLYVEPARKSIMRLKTDLQCSNCYSFIWWRNFLGSCMQCLHNKVNLNLHFRLIYHLFHPFRLLQSLPAHNIPLVKIDETFRDQKKYSVRQVLKEVQRRFLRTIVEY